jgi:hypothetical protein
MIWGEHAGEVAPPYDLPNSGTIELASIRPVFSWHESAHCIRERRAYAEEDIVDIFGQDGHAGCRCKGNQGNNQCILDQVLALFPRDQVLQLGIEFPQFKLHSNLLLFKVVFSLLTNIGLVALVLPFFRHGLAHGIRERCAYGGEDIVDSLGQVVMPTVAAKAISATTRHTRSGPALFPHDQVLQLGIELP